MNQPTESASSKPPRAEAAAGCKSKVGPLQDFETFHGFMSTPSDGLLILDACRKGALRLLKERPKVLLKTADKTSDGGKESSSVAIRSGTIVVFEEHETRMKRWRDGLKWTPSRVCGPFLIYRELDTAARGVKKKHAPTAARQSQQQSSVEYTRGFDPPFSAALIGQSSVKEGGLIKKTFAATLDNAKFHIISYYARDDILDGKLTTPQQWAAANHFSLDEQYWARAKLTCGWNQDAKRQPGAGADSETSTSPERKPEVYGAAQRAKKYALMNAVKAVSARTSSVSSTSPPPLSPPFVASSNSPSRRATTASPTTPPITDEQQPSAQRVYDSGNSQWSSASTHFSPNSIRDVSPAPTFLSASPTPSSVQSFASQHQTFIPGSTAQDTSSLFVPQFTSNSYQQQQQHHVNAGIDMSFSLPVGAHTTWSACSSMISDLNSNHFSGGVFSLPNNSTIHSPNPLPQSNLQSPPYSQPSTSRPLPSSSSSSSDPTHSHHLMSTPLDELTAVLGATTSDDTLDAFFGMDLEFDMFHPPASSTIITHNNNTIHESVSATAAEYTAVYPSETDPLDALFLPLSGLGPQPPTHYHPSQQEQHQQQSIKAFQALERAHNKFASTLYTTQPYNPYPPPSTQYLSPQNHHQQQHHQFGYDPVSPLTLSASHTSSTSTTLTSLPDPFELGHFSAPAGLGPGLSVLGMTLDPNTTSISPAPDDGPSSQPQSHHHHHRSLSASYPTAPPTTSPSYHRTPISPFI